MAPSRHEVEGDDVGVFLLGPSLGCVQDFIREGGNASGYLHCEPERGERITEIFQIFESATSQKSQGNVPTGHTLFVRQLKFDFQIQKLKKTL